MRVHDRLDRDGDDRGWKRFIAFALQAVLDGGLVECDEDDDRRRVYRLRRTRTFTFNLAKAMGYEVGGGTGRDTHDEGDEAALDEDAAAEPERVQVGGLRLVLRGEVQREEDGGVHVRVVDPRSDLPHHDHDLENGFGEISKQIMTQVWETQDADTHPERAVERAGLDEQREYALYLGAP